MQPLQRALGVAVFGHGVRVLQFLPDRRLRLFGQVVHHVAPLVPLTTLDESRLTGMTAHRRRQRLASLQHVQPRHAEVQPARRQIPQ
jgi:hypothetical protein